MSHGTKASEVFALLASKDPVIETMRKANLDDSREITLAYALLADRKARGATLKTPDPATSASRQPLYVAPSPKGKTEDKLFDFLCKTFRANLYDHPHKTVSESSKRVIEQFAGAAAEALVPFLAALSNPAQALPDGDYPDADGTDAAHPAWWRGHEHTAAVFCQKINEILDGKDNGNGVANAPWEATRRRLLTALSAPSSTGEGS